MNLVVHPDTVQMAHQYGCAAARQGKFGDFVHAFWDKGFGAYAASGGKDRSPLGEDKILTWVGQLGLDANRLREDANTNACKQRVEDDATELRKFRVNGTPAFFINGQYIGGGIPKEKFKEVIDAKLALADKSGLSGAAYYNQEIAGKGLRTFRSKADANPKKTKPLTADELRKEALDFLDLAYAQQKQQQAATAARTHDPNAVFAVDIHNAVAAGQVEGPPGAAVTIVEAWDYG
jgi:hypothetical protein